VATYPPHHFAVWLSLFSLNIAAGLCRCGSSSHTPADRTGGVKRNSLYLRFSGHMEISSFAHARYKYSTCTQEKCKLLCNLCVLWTVADGTLAGEQLLHAPCWISNTAVLSSSTCLLITPPPHRNQQFLTHDNNVVLATANSLEHYCKIFYISCKFSWLSCL